MSELPAEAHKASSPSSFSIFWISAKSVASTPSWWRQQAWVSSTEILMGFLAAWGLFQGFNALWVPLGLGLAYAMDGFAVALIASKGRSIAIALALFTMLAAFASSIMTTDYRWWPLCLAAGGLLAFRDQQTMHSLAWMPVRAHRRGGSSILALASGSILGAVLLAIVMVSAGFLTSVWNEMPQAIALAACVFLLPQQVWRTPKQPLTARVANPQPISPHLEWLLRLSLIFNAVNFLGRRIVLPLAVIALAARTNFGNDILPLLGGVLGLMGLLGMLARLPFTVSRKTQGEALLSWGARMSLLGWACIGLGAALMSMVGLAWILLMSGWVLLEITNKTWGTGYMEALRVHSVGNKITASRAHRLALQEFMANKSFGGAIGCGAAALFTPAAAPWLVAVMAIGCWVWLENPPSAKSLVVNKE
jgi:hypothetical protein